MVQLPADEAVDNVLSKFDFWERDIATLAEYCGDDAAIHVSASQRIIDGERHDLDKFKLRFDIAAMRADDAVLQAFDAEWDFDPAARWVESEVGFDSDGIARWSLSAFHEFKSPVSTNYRNLLISSATTR